MRAATRRDATNGEPTRMEGKAMRYGWAAFGLIGALSLTQCTLDRSAIVSPRYVWRCEATVRSSDGIVGTLSSEDGTFTNGRPFQTWFWAAEDPAEGEARVRMQWRRFMRARLEDPALPESLRARLGAPPYCLTEDRVTRTETQLTEPPPADLTTPEIDDCGALPPPPTSCGNPVGAHPILALMPPALPFGAVPVGSSSADVFVNFENVGDGRLCLGTPMVDRVASPNPGDFVVDASNCAPLNPAETIDGMLVLSAGTRTSCQVVVRFGPQDPGARQAEVRATSNDPDNLVSRLSLTGTGSPGVLALSGTNLCFNVASATYPAFPGPQHRRIVTLTNSGPGAVRVDSVATPAADTGWTVRVLDAVSGAAVPTPFTLTSGGSVSLRIFAAVGTVGNSTLIIQSNAATPRTETVLLGPDSGCTP